MLLRQPRVFAFPLDVERLPLRIQILRSDLDLRALLDLVAHAPARFDRLGQLGQAFGVERVGAVEEFETRLVEVDDGDALELEAVLGEPFGGGGLHAPRRSPAAARAVPRASSARPPCEAPLRTGPPSVPATPSESKVRRPSVWAARLTSSRVEPTRTKKSATTSTRMRFLVIRPCVWRARHLDPHHIHADRRDLVQHRNDEGAAADDDFLAAETRPNERRLLRSSADRASAAGRRRSPRAIARTISQRITDPTVSRAHCQ